MNYRNLNLHINKKLIFYPNKIYYIQKIISNPIYLKEKFLLLILINKFNFRILMNKLFRNMQMRWLNGISFQRNFNSQKSSPLMIF